MSVNLPPVSLIISTRSRPDLIKETVVSVLAGAEVPAEIIVIDQSETANPELEALSTPVGCTLRYVWQKSSGVGKGRNTGFSAAKHNLLAVIDDDMYVAPDWFHNLISGLLDAGENSIVTGKVMPFTKDQSGGFVPSTIEDDQPVTYSGRISKDVLFSGNMALYRSIICNLGGFDERMGPGTDFPSSEDNDFGYRLLAAGYQICYLPDAVVYHRAWRPKSSFNALRWGYGIGRGAYYAKHFSLRDRYMLRRMVMDIFQHTIQFPFHILHQRDQAIGDLVLSIGILFGAIQWIVKYH